jgi:hypothetical protein
MVERRILFATGTESSSTEAPAMQVQLLLSPPSRGHRRFLNFLDLTARPL